MLSRTVRSYFGLPLEGPTGLSEEHERFLAEREKTGSGRRGLKTEGRFFQAWSKEQVTSRGIAFVRGATFEEDLGEKTDAVMGLRTGKEIRIQIKSSESSRGKGFEWYMRRGIVLIIIAREDTPQMIRMNTIKAIMRFYEKWLSG